MKSLLLFITLFLLSSIAQAQCQPIIVQSGYPIVVNPQCGDNNGSIEVLAQGNGAITYSLNGQPFQASGLFDMLAPGNYTVTMMDAAGCTEALNFPLSNQSEIIVNSIIEENAGCNADNGRITVNATGVDPLMYQLDGGSPQTGNVFSGLAPGNYTITITDPNNCVEIRTARIRRDGISIDNTVVVDSNCPGSNGSITITASGTGTVRYSFEGGPFTTTNSWNGLAAGAYDIDIEDGAGCTREERVVVNSDINYTIDITNSVCESNNGEIVVNVTSPGNWEYSNDNGANYQTSNTFSG
ncbi:MAG: hypothetical protein KTR13_00890, partial [Saprospiraceae bacterium]|nr:hypothetical protein [Saprospiraceae bacterium]